MINRFVFIYIILIFSIFSLSSNSQVVWKSDGTIIGSDGEIKKESYGARFQKQLLNPTDDWPKATGTGDGIQQNYFGNDIFIPGTPLLRMSGIDFGSDYSLKLAELNLFIDSKEMQKFIIANANINFLDNLGISDNDAITYVSSVNYNGIPNESSNIKELIKDKEKIFNLSKDFAKTIDKKLDKDVGNKLKGKVENQIKDKVEEEVQEKVEEKVQEQVQQQVEQKVQEQVQQSIEEKIQQSLDDYYDQLEAEYKAKGWTICERTDNSISASSGGC